MPITESSRPGFREEVRILAVIPSIGAPGFETVARLQQELESVDAITSLVISNARKMTQYLESAAVPYISSGTNSGFGHSVQLGASSRSDWDWLLVVNDDISLNLEAFIKAVEQNLQRSSGKRSIIYLDENTPRPLPRRREVFLQVSLIGKVLDTFRVRSVPEDQSYRSFSCVAISRELYDLNGGFDKDLPFTYEDADFVARARSFGAHQYAVQNSGVVHIHSVSSGKHVDKVLPVATYSAVRYLDKIGGSTRLNSAIVLIALLLRLAFVPVLRVPRKKHLAGVYYSVIAVVRRSRVSPGLPEYSKL